MRRRLNISLFDFKTPVKQDMNLIYLLLLVRVFCEKSTAEQRRNHTDSVVWYRSQKKCLDFSTTTSWKACLCHRNVTHSHICAGLCARWKGLHFILWICSRAGWILPVWLALLPSVAPNPAGIWLTAMSIQVLLSRYTEMHRYSRFVISLMSCS